MDNGVRFYPLDADTPAAKIIGDKAMQTGNITREYIEQLNDVEPYCFESDREERWFNIGLQYGLDIADSNPKSSWISVDDDLPCNHEELIENENYTKNVLVVLSWNDNPSKKHIWICDMCNVIGLFNTNWYWQNKAHYHVVYWKPLPELPKEQED